MYTEKQIISLWLGEEAQNVAQSFYNLQAEQFFDDEEDPIEQGSIWKDCKKKVPRCIIYNTEIKRLSELNKIKHKKMIKEIEKKEISFDSMYFNVDMGGMNDKNEEQEQEENWEKFDNWTDKWQNYKLIDVNFNWGKENLDYEVWKHYYKLKQDSYQDQLRKELEKSDFLRAFTLCSDDYLSGFTSCLLEYLRDECPKVEYIYADLSNQTVLPTLANIYPLVDMYISIDSKPSFPYFNTPDISSLFSPLFNSFFTPLTMKQMLPHHYLQNIVVNGQKLFNVAYTLPIINKNLQLHLETNIFKYLNLAEKKEDEAENRVNFGNSKYLTPNKDNGSVLCESFVLKGHIDNLGAHFAPRTEALSMKYLPGILSAPTTPALTYDPFYHAQYEEIVQAYPFYSVIFTHQCFASGLRKYEAKQKKSPIFNQMESQWRQGLLEIADSYKEQHHDSD